MGIYKCAKCGTPTTGQSCITINDPTDRTRSIMVDVCNGCNTSKDLKKTLTERLYPEQIDVQERNAKSYGQSYEESKRQWHIDHPEEVPPANW